MAGLVVLMLLGLGAAAGLAAEVSRTAPFPPALESYGDAHVTDFWELLRGRLRQEPFNLAATVIFLAAMVHTFLANKFARLAHAIEARHRQKLAAAGTPAREPETGADSHRSTCMSAAILHFFGEVEVIFGIWVVPLVVLMSIRFGLRPALGYLEDGVSYLEPVFVVVIMVMSATKPVMRLAEDFVRLLARLGGGGPGAWWLAILTAGPVLGSVITEPAAMTISALLLGRQFYALKPPPRLAYATLGLLFVNVSVGGVLTHFAAPPVLMVAGPWQWDTPFMFAHFGWIALVGIAVANLGYYLVFRRSIAALRAAGTPETAVGSRETIPLWVTLGHVLFMVWTVANAHYTALVIGGFLFFVAFAEITADYQSELQMRSPMLVGFFLAGLVIHGGLQKWWIAPLLDRLTEVPLLLGAAGLTAFNDNAAITYLATLVPDLTDGMKCAVVAGAVAGGGLTVIANAPNPAGQAILGRHFSGGIAPLALLLGALPATAIMLLCFLSLR